MRAVVRKAARQRCARVKSISLVVEGTRAAPRVNVGLEDGDAQARFEKEGSGR